MGSDRDKESGQVTTEFSATVLTRHIYLFGIVCAVVGIIAITIGLAFPLWLGVK
jgi:hypothetical protein